jgi:hypothetical protein
MLVQGSVQVTQCQDLVRKEGESVRAKHNAQEDPRVRVQHCAYVHVFNCRHTISTTPTKSVMPYAHHAIHSRASSGADKTRGSTLQTAESKGSSPEHAFLTYQAESMTSFGCIECAQRLQRRRTGSASATTLAVQCVPGWHARRHAWSCPCRPDSFQ